MLEMEFWASVTALTCTSQRTGSMTQSTLGAFELAVEIPYPIPFEDGTAEHTARKAHRAWYWGVHGMERYVCPDCDRMLPEAVEFDVHHKDENPLNGHPLNLIALCRRCHRWRHGNGATISGLSLEEWKMEFTEPGSAGLGL